MQSGRHPKKRHRPERVEPERRAHQEHQEEATTPAIDSADLISRLGLRWTGLAAVLAALLFFWTWLFLDLVPGRGSALLLIFSPEIWIGHWFGNVGNGQPPMGFFDRLPILLAAAFILVASLGPGSILVSLLTKRESFDRLEHMVLSMGAGLNIASLFVLAGGMVQGSLHQPWWIWLGLLLGLLLFPAVLWRLMFSEGNAGEESAEQAHAAKLGERSVWWAPWVIGALSLPYVFGGMLPPWDFDVREYHLQAPKEWLQRGQIDFLPHNVYANMPLGAEVQAITATTILGGGDEAWWLGGLTAKLLISLFAPLTAVLLWSIGRRTGYASAGLIAAVCYLSLPWVAHVSLSGLNDGVLGFYLLAAWWVWLRSEEGDWRALILAGFLGGAAAAVKYPALVFVVVPMIVEMLLRKLGVRGTKRVKYVGLRQFSQAAVAMVLLLVGVVAGGGLWYVKNAVQTGNPVYPLLVARLGGETRTPEKDARWVKAHAVPQDEQGRRYSLTQVVTAISNLGFRGNFASPILLPLALLGCWGVVRIWLRQSATTTSSIRFPLLAIGLCAFVFAAWFLITHRLERFLVPALPLVALLAGFGYVYAKEQAGSTIARGFLGVGLVYCWMFIAGLGATADVRWFTALTHLRSDPVEAVGPRENASPQRLSPAQRWLAKHLAGDDAVLMVGGASVWDLPGRPRQSNVYYNTCFDDCLLVDWLAGKSAAEDQRAAFESQRVKYVCVDWGELRRYRSAGNYGYDLRFSPVQLDELVRSRVLKEETRFGADATVKDNKRPRPPQQIYRVLTSAEATADASAAAAAAADALSRENVSRQKAASKNIKPTPKAAPPKSANQSRKSD